MTTRPELSGNQKRKMRTASRLYAVQALFQMEHSGQASDVVAREFLDHRFGAIYDEGEMQEGDPDLFEKIVNDAVNHQALIDQMTDRALVAKWPIARIDPTLRSLFRAGAELTQSIPAQGCDRGIRRSGRGLLPDGKESKFCNAFWITWPARPSPRRFKAFPSHIV